MHQKGITSRRAQRAFRACGAICGAAAILLALIAYITLYGRGLFATGIQIMLCIGTSGVGWFSYTQAAFPRDWIMFGMVECRSPYAMLEPAWSLLAALATVLLAWDIIATA